MKRAPKPRPTAHREDTCPLISLAFEFDAMTTMHNKLDCERSKLAKDETHIIDRKAEAVWDRINAIRVEASYLEPHSVFGASFQIMLIASQLDVLTDADGYEERELRAQMRRMFNGAVKCLMQHDERIPGTRQYCLSGGIDEVAFLRTVPPTWIG